MNEKIQNDFSDLFTRMDIRYHDRYRAVLEETDKERAKQTVLGYNEFMSCFRKWFISLLEKGITIYSINDIEVSVEYFRVSEQNRRKEGDVKLELMFRVISYDGQHNYNQDADMYFKDIIVGNIEHDFVTQRAFDILWAGDDLNRELGRLPEFVKREDKDESDEEEETETDITGAIANVNLFADLILKGQRILESVTGWIPTGVIS